MDSNRNFDGLSPYELNSLYKEFLSEYSVKDNSPEKKQTIANQIEAVLTTAVQEKCIGAARQLANTYAGQRLYTCALDVWAGLDGIPELQDTQKAVACIETFDSNPNEYRPKKFLAAAYAKFDPKKLDQLLEDVREIGEFLDLKSLFNRAQQIHSGNVGNDVNTSLKALRYLCPLFSRFRKNENENLTLYKAAVGLIIDIADRHNVLRAAFDKVGTQTQEVNGLTSNQLYQIVVGEVFSTDFGRPPAPQLSWAAAVVNDLDRQI